jgi:LacI family transcriptional regulator
MLEGHFANQSGLLRRRVTLREIAEKAGVSIATVDRVLSGRAIVRKSTATRVQDAAQALGYQFAEPMTVRLGQPRRPVRCGFLLQRRSSAFNQHIAQQLNELQQQNASLGVELFLEFLDEYLEPSKVAAEMRSMAGRVDAVAVVATESPYISEAIDFLMERRTPVVALLSDLSSTNLAGYVGINNRMAGRSAAWAIAHCARQTGTVGVLIGSHGYLGQEEREIGFRSYFRAKALDFKVLEPIVCFDEPENAYKQTIELFKTSDELVGLYSVGGGNKGIIRAIEESRISHKLAYVCHELTPTTRVGLSAGVIDVVLAHDVPALARATLKMLIDIKNALPSKKQSSIVPFTICTSENI